MYVTFGSRAFGGRKCEQMKMMLANGIAQYERQSEGENIE